MIDLDMVLCEDEPPKSIDESTEAESSLCEIGKIEPFEPHFNQEVHC